VDRTFPARLHVLLARNGEDAVLIRRGPSKEVATIGWDRRRDTFFVGQWLRGRIYERRADLSPDGRHLIYFAMNGHWGAESRGAWTAVSRAPFLKALVMLPKGDCWHGGGLFSGNGRYWLNDGYGHDLLRDSREVQRDHDGQPTRSFGGECPGVYYPRLLRDGWSLVSAAPEVTVFERPLPYAWRLRKYAHSAVDHPEGAGCYWDTHALVDPSGAEHEPHESRSWGWADLDGSRLVWARAGTLWAAALDGDGPGEPRALFDANGMTFERRQAPY
jgi:hypothetical protein